MATSVIGALSVEITVDAKGVKDGIKASGEALEVGGKQLRASANKWGKWAVAAVAAVGAVTIAIVKANLEGIRELKATATAADETVEAFQRGAFAAEQFGVSQEKYGDILKDVNDRVGDFLVTGAGPMVDFFDIIGPKVDVTAESFKGLSGSQSLGLYISSLQKAGASQQEMTFFMEALAGDATRLIPLFKDNAAALNILTGEAEALGIGLSAIDVEKAEMASRSLAKSLAVTEAFGQQLTVELAPIIGSVVDLFEDMAKEAGGASQFIQKGIGGVIDVVGVFADGLRGVEVIFKGLEIAALGFSALAVNVFSVVTNVIAKSMDGWVMMVNHTIANINSAFDTGIEPIDLASDSSFVTGLNETAAEMIAVVSNANGELHDLMMQPLPSDGIKSFVDASIVEYERLATEKAAIDSQNKETQGVIDNGEGAGESAEAKRIREENDAILTALIEQGDLKEETMMGRFAREQQVLEEALANKKITEETFANASIALDERIGRSKLQAASSTLNALATIMTVGGKKAQKIGQGFAIASAVIDGQTAAVSAYMHGTKIGGPVVGSIFAAASVVKTAGMIASIKSGSKSSSGGGGGVPSLPTSAESSGGGSSENLPESRNISINLTGEGLMSTEQVRDLIGQINEATNDGVQLITTGA